MKKKCLFFFLLRSSIKQLLQYYTERIDRKITHSLLSVLVYLSLLVVADWSVELFDYKSHNYTLVKPLTRWSQFTGHHFSPRAACGQRHGGRPVLLRHMI